MTTSIHRCKGLNPVVQAAYGVLRMPRSCGVVLLRCGHKLHQALERPFVPGVCSYTV